MYYGKKEQFYLIPFLCPVWNIAADYFRPITFSVPGTEVMVEKILSIGQQAGAGAGHQTLPSHNYAPALHRYFRHHKQIRAPGGQINFWAEIVRSWGKIGSCEIVKCWSRDWKDNLVQFSHFLFSIFPRPGWCSWSNQVIISAWCVPDTVNSIITLLAGNL